MWRVRVWHPISRKKKTKNFPSGPQKKTNENFVWFWWKPTAFTLQPPGHTKWPSLQCHFSSSFGTVFKFSLFSKVTHTPTHTHTNIQSLLENRDDTGMLDSLHGAQEQCPFSNCIRFSFVYQWQHPWGPSPGELVYTLQQKWQLPILPMLVTTREYVCENVNEVQKIFKGSKEERVWNCFEISDLEAFVVVVVPALMFMETFCHWPCLPDLTFPKVSMRLLPWNTFQVGVAW